MDVVAKATGTLDPDEALRQLRQYIAVMGRCAEEGEPLDPDDAALVAEKFEALDLWLKNGGFLPKDWTKIS